MPPPNAKRNVPRSGADHPVDAVEKVNSSHLSIRALRAGFRRAGRAWPAEEVTVAVDEFTAEQVEQLLAEPMLVVMPIAAETAE